MAARTITERIHRASGIALILFAGLTGCAEPQAANGLETIAIDGHTFHLEVARDEHSRRVGMMHRESIPKDGGMLFIYPHPEVMNFWMGNCLVDIDIIFLDARGRITAMHRMKAEPLRREGESEIAYHERLADYSSRYPAQFAIELQAGWLDELDIHVEDRIELDLDRLKAMAR